MAGPHRLAHSPSGRKEPAAAKHDVLHASTECPGGHRFTPRYDTLVIIPPDERELYRLLYEVDDDDYEISFEPEEGQP